MIERSRAKWRLFLFLCGFGVLLFSGLGMWQVERLRWKLDLIARVDARVHAPPVPPPDPVTWPLLDPKAIEYRHVRAAGVLLENRETLVDALTDLGPGFWVVTPLQTAHGTILVNRGFVPTDRAAPRTRAAGQVSGPVVITGLMRLTEPNGRFLRRNRPLDNRWYSRDVAEIAKARGLGRAAPFFIDADSAPNKGGLPVGGLTVVHFRNAHLLYALTWFALAGLALAGLALLRKDGLSERVAGS